MPLLAAIAVCAALLLAAVTGSASEEASARLAWAPPTLSDPVSIAVTNANRRLYLDDSRDYRLTVVEPLTRELWIEGGRNVVVLGGHVTVDEPGAESSYQDNTGIKIRSGNPSGTVHVEGVLVDGRYLVDGIAIATARNLQIENVRVARVHNDLKGAHADCVQVQAGVGQLRIDGFTCTTELQGVFLGDHGGAIAGVDLRRMNLVGAPGKHLLWQSTPSYPVNISDVRLAIAAEYRAWAPFGFWVYPQQDGRTSAGAVDRQRRAVVSRDGKRLWFVGSRISGVVEKALPGARDFVPDAVAGMSYASPGYARRSSG
jgi:hypothetical protein